MVRRSSLILFLAIFLLGCRPVQAPPTSAPVSASPIPPTATPIPAKPTLQVANLIRNAQYQLGVPDTLQVVQLKDGEFEQSTAGAADYISAKLTDFVAAGDLDSDGRDEVAALLAENYGGSGVFVFLAIYKMENGAPKFLTSSLVDDRAQLNALSIENEEVFLDSVIHGANDAMCCPTFHNTRHYRLINDQLDMSDFQTFTPDGKPRTIKIQSPSNGNQVSGIIQAKGSVAIAPFENTLKYSIKDAAGVELSQGSLNVTSSSPGGPGTFEATIPLGNALTSGVILLEIQDVSAADGSLLATDSVQLVVK